MSLLKRKPKSEARDRLAEALKARAEIEARLTELSGFIGRLTKQTEAVGPALDALARHDAIQSAKLAQWAESGDATAPESDWEHREKLERELSAAKATAASAQAAKAGPEAQYVAEGNKLPGVRAYANAAIVEILDEAAEPYIAEAIKAQAEAARAVERVVSAIDCSRELMVKLASGPNRDIASAAFTQLAQKAAAVHEHRPAGLEFAQRVRAKWNEFIADLYSDPHVLPAVES
jgi:hypothetical protein